jgi:hypothetical protein
MEGEPKDIIRSISKEIRKHTEGEERRTKVKEIITKTE